MAITFATVDSIAAEAVQDAIGAASARSPEPQPGLSSRLAFRLQLKTPQLTLRHALFSGPWGDRS